MPFARVRVALLPASNDLRLESPALQSTLGKFRRYLRISDIKVSTPMFYRDVHGAAGGYVGEFIVPLSHAVRPPFALIVSAWLQDRPGRAVHLRISEGEVVARSTEEAQQFLRRAHELRKAPWSSDEGQGT